MADVNVRSSPYPGYVLVALQGELDICGAARFARAMSAAAAPGSRVIVDLAGLTFMDCSCLHVLVSARKQALQARGDLLLAAPRGLVARLLSLIDLTGWLRVFASAEEAANGDGMPPVTVCLALEQADGEVNPGGGRSITGRGAVPCPDDMHGERRPEVPAEAQLR